MSKTPQPYLIIKHTKTPVAGTKTEKAGWLKNAELNEIVSFELAKTDYRGAPTFKRKTMSESSVIIDLLKKDLVKNRFEHVPTKDLVEFYFEKYAKKISEVLVRYAMAVGPTQFLEEETSDVVVSTEE